MLFVLPIQIDEVDRVAIRRSAPVTWTLMMVIAAVFIGHTVAVAALDHHWRFIPGALITADIHLTASWRLYSDPALFEPWQIWTCILLQDGWWEFIAAALILWSVGRSLELSIGSARMIGALLAITGLAAAAHLVVARGHGTSIGAHGLVAGLIGMAWALFARGQVRCVAGYWLIVIVGVIRFDLGMSLFALIAVAQDLVRLSLAHDLWGVDTAIAGLAIGGALGALMRRTTA
jgi:membrane associated rhomboid family serine protease